MLLKFAGFVMPVLLVFGLYHLLTWFDVMKINRKPFWKRVGLTSAISHVFLAIGFFVFSYADYSANLSTTLAGIGFDGYLFYRSEFWSVMTIFDTAPMLALLGVLAVLDRLGMNPPMMVTIVVAVTLVVGTLQWYLVGGGVGRLLESFWSGLKTGDDIDEDWF